MSNISTAVYKKTSKLKKSEIEVIFFRPTKNKTKINKTCKAYKSSKTVKKIVSSPSESHIAKKKSKNSKSEKRRISDSKCYNTNDMCIQTDAIKKVPSQEQTEMNHCLELLLQEKNRKVRSFMTKLLMKKKKVEQTKSVLPIIVETEPPEIVDIKEKNESSIKSIHKNENIKSDHKKISDEILSTNNCFGEKSEIAQNPPIEEKIPQLHEICDNSTIVKDLSTISSSDTLVQIRLIERKTRNKFTLQQIEFVSSLNQVNVSSKINIAEVSSIQKKSPTTKKQNQFTDHTPTLPGKHYTEHSMKLGQQKCCVPSVLLKLDSSELKKSFPNCKCQSDVGRDKRKFSSKKRKMLDSDGLPNQIYSRVSNWISSNDFLMPDNGKADTDIETVISNSKNTDFTSVSKINQYDRVIVEERTDVVKFDEMGRINTSTENFTEMLKNINTAQKKSVRTLSKFSQYSPFQVAGNLKSASAPPTQFSVIVEGEESVGLSILSYGILNYILVLYVKTALLFQFYHF